MPKLSEIWRQDVIDEGNVVDTRADSKIADLSEIERDALAEQDELDERLKAEKPGILPPLIVDSTLPGGPKRVTRLLSVKRCEKVDMVIAPDGTYIQIMRYYKNANHDLYRLLQKEIDMLGEVEAKKVVHMLLDPQAHEEILV